MIYELNQLSLVRLIKSSRFGLGLRAPNALQARGLWRRAPSEKTQIWWGKFISHPWLNDEKGFQEVEKDFFFHISAIQLATLMTEFDVSFKREKIEDLVKGTRSVLEDAEALAKPACWAWHTWRACRNVQTQERSNIHCVRIVCFFLFLAIVGCVWLTFSKIVFFSFLNVLVSMTDFSAYIS